MSAKRVLVVVSACLAVVVLGWVALIGALYAWGGVATVRVEDSGEGVSVFVPVPMAVVDAALTTTAWVVPEEEWLQLHVELGDWRPMISELLAELDRLPDVTLVEVVDGGERVRVYKESGDLRVEVTDSDVSIRVSIPARSAHRVLSRLSRLV